MKMFIFSCTFFLMINMASFEPQDELLKEWDQFKNRCCKQYQTQDEDQSRLEIFAKNKNFVASHNKQFELGETTYRLGMNKFGDLSLDEFVAKRNGLKMNLALPRSNKDTNEAIAHLQSNYGSSTELDFIDWRDRGAVTQIKDQGHRGSCWAFSATGALEAQHYRKTGELISLSEQSLMDCSSGYENYGCEGGFMNNAFLYIKDNNGIATDSTYAYEAKQNNSCHYNPSKRGATLTDYVDLPKGDENFLKTAIATVGPICVAIDAGHKSFQLYESGIYNEEACSPTDLNHGVLAVGYGTNRKGQDYWLIKNSWGTEWGIDGYMMMARNKNNLCGVATAASYPIVSGIASLDKN